MRAPKRKFSKDFKLEAVKMVTDGGLSKSEVGRRLDVSPAQIGNWLKAFQLDGTLAFPGNGKLRPDALIHTLSISAAPLFYLDLPPYLVSKSREKRMTYLHLGKQTLAKLVL